MSASELMAISWKKELNTHIDQYTQLIQPKNISFSSV